ncbi:hypothetical protein Y032_0039g27 [Ancylostoma ceylanicum]|uniref:Uncharacterized protein n=2 Tax=Ancylostoma ceylanicum TaxID=53326 RepID=A0A016UJV1_9BILA|nr:hypothetical protein Y032_0039g27 [Ancylostoma ceylanicum]
MDYYDSMSLLEISEDMGIAVYLPSPDQLARTASAAKWRANRLRFHTFPPTDDLIHGRTCASCPHLSKQCLCIMACAVMAVLAQRIFNTRGDLNFYLCEMTFELFLYAVAVCNIAAPSHFARYFNILLFLIAVGVNFSHVLIVVRTQGTYWKCEEGGIIMQHCVFMTIPTHYHTLYTAAFLLFLHLANTLICVAISIFYDGSLDYYLENTPGAPQWITDQPLHRHHRREEIEERRKEQDLLKKLQKPLELSDLPPGTLIKREQTEHSVRTTTYDRSGKANVGPERVKMTRTYTLKAPGGEPATGRREWVITRPSSATGSSTVPLQDVKSTPVPKVVVKSRENVEAPPGKAGEQAAEKPVGKPIEVPPEMRGEKRRSAGKEPYYDDVPSSRISRMPALISPIAYLTNKNLGEKQSDYMY